MTADWIRARTVFLTITVVIGTFLLYIFLKAAFFSTWVSGTEIDVKFNGDGFRLDRAKEQSRSGDHLVVELDRFEDVHHFAVQRRWQKGEYTIKLKAKARDLVCDKQHEKPGGAHLTEKFVILGVDAGTYDWKTFSDFFALDADVNAKLGIGIGGWKNGKGRLEVKDIEIKKIQ